MRLRNITLLLLIFLCSIGTWGYERYNFHTIGIGLGMADNYVKSIVKDRMGFMWFATVGGLSRYDGYLFRNYHVTPLGDYNDDIQSVDEDGDGNLWVKSEKRFYIYNKEKDMIDSLVTLALERYGFSKDTRDVYVDRQKDLWGVTADKVYYYNFKDRKVSIFPYPEKKNIVKIVNIHSRTLALCADGSVFSLNYADKAWRLFALTNKLSSWKQDIYVDNDLHLWIFSLHGKGLDCYDIVTGRKIQYPGMEKMGSKIITAVSEDESNNIWVGTDNDGISILNFNEGTCHSITASTASAFSLPTNHISCFYSDDDNIMWVGTSKVGVCYASLHGLLFRPHLFKIAADTKCISKDVNGNIWFGFDGEGLACSRLKGDAYSFFSKEEGNAPSNMVVSSYLGDDGRLWFGTYGDGPFYYEKGAFTIIPKNIVDRYKLQYVGCITGDAKGNIWFGTFMDGLCRYSKDGSTKTYRLQNSVLRSNSLSALSCKDGRNVYIGTASGLYHVDAQTLKMKAIHIEINRKHSADVAVKCLLEDSRGWLWAGTSDGICVYDKSDRKFIVLTLKDGLSNGYIKALVEDRKGNVWASTNNGITYIHVDKEVLDNSAMSCYAYYKAEGIGDMTFNQKSAYLADDGKILMGSINGFLEIDPDKVMPKDRNRKIVFTALYIDDKIINVGDKDAHGNVTLKRSLQLLDELILNYYDDNFTLEVSSMDYGRQDKSTYLYKLKGDHNWIKMDGNRIHFNKLPAGRYTLEVKTGDAKGADDISTLLINVRPPLWASPVSYVFYLLIALLIVYMLFRRYRIKQMKRAMYHEQDMLARQQHALDEQKINFFTNVSHDLRTPLSLIMIPLERLLKGSLPPDLKGQLELINRNANILLEEVNQLLDFKKIDDHKVTLHLLYEDLAGIVRSISDSFASQIKEKGLSFTTDISDKRLMTDLDRNKTERILLNLLSNAVKYNVEGGTVSLSLKRDGNTAIITVADTGIGIESENKKKIFDRFFQENRSKANYQGNGLGLNIVKEYIDMMDAKITVSDNTPQGTVFTILLPIRHQPDVEEAKAENGDTAVHKVATASAKRPALLLVDDNDDFRNFLKDCLQDEYTIFDAPDGRQALDILGRENVQMVISDVMMPVMDGLELCKRIKSNILLSHIPVILLTAKTADQHQIEGLQYGADEYISKPFNLEILKLRIHKILEWTANSHQQFEKKIDVSPSEITISSLDEQLITKAIKTVEDNMGNAEFSVEDLSAAVGMTRGNLYKKLMSITGKSPLEFIRILRIKRGRSLMEQGNTSISDVAFSVGFSPKQFSKYFKEEYGLLPSEFLAK